MDGSCKIHLKRVNEVGTRKRPQTQAFYAMQNSIKSGCSEGKERKVRESLAAGSTRRWEKIIKYITLALLSTKVQIVVAASTKSVPADLIIATSHPPSPIIFHDDTDYTEENDERETPSNVSDNPLWNSSLFGNINDTEYFWNGSLSSEEEFESDTEPTGLYDVPIYLVILLSMLYGTISAIAVVGNVLVLWVVITSPRMRTKINLFIANLALADIIIALFAIPFQFQAALLQRWNLPYFLCAFCPFVQVLSVNVSVITLSAIALDRYRAILHPFRAIRISKKEAIYAVVIIWFVSVMLALPQEFDYKVMEQKENGGIKPVCSPVLLSHTFRKYYILALVVIQYLLPLLIISGAYARMAARLWGSNAPGNKEETRDENALRSKKRVVKMLALVVVLFGLCWLPLQLYNFFQMITAINEYQYINIIWFCFHWLAMSNSCYNPFIYAIFSDKFQTEFRTRLRCIFRRKLQPRESATDEAAVSEASDQQVANCSLGTPTGRYRTRSRNHYGNEGGVIMLREMKTESTTFSVSESVDRSNNVITINQIEVDLNHHHRENSQC